jgi:hypothetical protein
MFRRFTSATRIRLAAAFALGYALCVAAPVGAVAFAGNVNTPAHCMTEFQSVAAAHIHMTDTDHQAGTSHHAAAGHDETTTPDTAKPLAKCCGLFGVTAIPQAQTVIALPAIAPAKCRAVATDSLFGQDPGRIDRPPRSLVLI